MSKPEAKWKIDYRQYLERMNFEELLDELISRHAGLDISTDYKHDNWMCDAAHEEVLRRWGALVVKADGVST